MVKLRPEMDKGQTGLRTDTRTGEFTIIIVQCVKFLKLNKCIKLFSEFTLNISSARSELFGGAVELVIFSAT